MVKIIFILVVCISSVFSHHVNHPNKVMIAYADEWPPFSYRDENGEMKGILVDLMDTLLHEMLHVEVVHSGFPWKMAQVLAKEGIYDALITFPSKNRKDLYLVTEEPLINLEWKGFTSVNSKKMNLIMQSENPLILKNELIYCAVLGDETTEKLYTDIGVKSHKSKNVDSAVKVLYEGRTDFFVNSKLTTLNLILKNGLGDGIKMHQKVYKKVPFHFLLSNNSDINKELIPKLDYIIRKMKSNKKYNDLLENIESKEFHKWLLK